MTGGGNAGREHLAYTSFGTLVDGVSAGTTWSASAQAVDGTSYGYTGQTWDAAAGLWHYDARWYDSGSGRFLSQDPLGLAAGDANFYRYVGNNPASYSDPTGLFEDASFEFDSDDLGLTGVFLDTSNLDLSGTGAGGGGFEVTSDSPLFDLGSSPGGFGSLSGDVTGTLTYLDDGTAVIEGRALQ